MRFAGLIGLLLLAACGDTHVANESTANRIRMNNETHEGLLRLEPGPQRLAMLRAIRGTGYTCQRVDNSGYQQEYRNMQMWVATCGPQPRDFAVFVAPNGDIQVRPCMEAAQLRLPACRPLPPAVAVESPFREGASDNAYRNEQ